MKAEHKIIIGIVVISAILLFLGIYSYNQNKPKDLNELKDTVADKSLLIRDDSSTLGPNNAKIKLVEFADFECEACAAAHPILQRLLKEYNGNIQFVFRNFPNHFNSMLAAKSAEAAGQEGKFWVMHDKLLENQLEWGEKKVPVNEVFIKYAKEIGLNVPTFTDLITKNTFEDKIARDKKDGISLGVRATPTFFLNGKKFEGIPPYEDLKKMIDKELGVIK
jgi:protein-disulfide isomerase